MFKKSKNFTLAQIILCSGSLASSVCIAIGICLNQTVQTQYMQNFSIDLVGTMLVFAFFFGVACLVHANLWILWIPVLALSILVFGTMPLFMFPLQLIIGGFVLLFFAGIVLAIKKK